MTKEPKELPFFVLLVLVLDAQAGSFLSLGFCGILFQLGKNLVDLFLLGDITLTMWRFGTFVFTAFVNYVKKVVLH